MGKDCGKTERKLIRSEVKKPRESLFGANCMKRDGRLNKNALVKVILRTYK